MLTNVIDIPTARKRLRAERAKLEAELAEIAKDESALDLLERSKYLQVEVKESQPLLPDILKEPSLKDRCVAALNKMPEKFTQKFHMKTVNEDGVSGEINKHSHSVTFVRMMKEGRLIRLNEKDPETNLNLYSKNNEFQG